MSNQPNLVQVVVVEPDVEVARAIARLAFDAVSREPALLVGAASTLDGARALIDGATARDGARLVVVCAPELAGESGLRVLEHATKTHADVRVVLLTSGEHDALVEALRMGVDGVVAKPVALPALRSILKFVAHEPERHVVRLRDAVDDAARDPLAGAREALEAALDAVELAEERLRDAGARAPETARETVHHARRLAVEAQRRVLEAERSLAERQHSTN